VNGALPVVASETGYPQSYIPLDRANKYDSRLFFEFFNHGIVRTYAYELIDESQVSGHESTFGLLYANGTAKPMFNTIANLITLLKDPGSAFTPGSLNYSFSGAPASLHHTLLQKRNGVFYLVLWLELDYWNATSANVTVNFAGTAGHVNQYDPLASVSPKTAWNNVSSVVLPVSDQATILEISSGGSAQLPDLIPIPGSLSYDTTTHRFTVQVKNQGTGPTPSGVVIGNAFYVDGNWVTWGAVPGPLAAGASVTVDSSGGGAYTISAGTHTIGVTIDDVNRMAESNKSNNQLSQTITVP
jgi:CARDB